jgi:PAS domain S-box-containing protein
MTELTDFNFVEDDFTAENLAKFELLKLEKVEDLNKLAELLNQIVAAKVVKLSQEKDEFYGKQLVSKEFESDIFYNHLPCGYFSTSANGIITKINDILLVWLGYTKEDIIGKVTWQSLLSVGGKIYFETHYSPLLQLQGFVQEISFEMVKKDKTRLPILINTKQIKDENGNVQMNYSTVFEVSQRKSYEKELLIAKRTVEKQNELIEYTFRNASIPIYYVLEDASFYNFNDIAAENLGYTREELFTLKLYDLDKDHDEKKLASLWAILKVEKKITIETQQKKKDGTIIDVIVTANYVKYGDIELSCSYLMDVTEKKKQEQQLQLLEYSYKNTDRAMSFLDMNALFIDFNQATANMLGYSYEEFKGKTLMDINPIVTKEFWVNRWKNLIANPNQKFEAKFKRKDGTLIDVAVSTNSIELNGKIVNFGLYEDITEKKRLEEQMMLVDYTFRNSTTPINIVNKDASIFDFNEAAQKLLGYTKEEFKAISIPDIDPDYQNGIWPIHWEELKKVKSLSFETRLRKKNGDMINANIEANFIKYGDKELNCVFFTDITEKKRIEENLKLSAFTIENAAWGLVYFNADGTIYNCNHAFAKMYGYTSIEEVKTKTVFDFSTDYTIKTWKQYWDNLREKKSLQFVGKRIKKDGTIINVEINPNMIQFGELELNCAFVYDVTNKLKAEEDLKQSNQRYEYATLATSEVIWEADLLKNETFISKNFTTFFGHPVSDGWMPMEKDIWMQNINPDDFDIVMEERYAALNSKESNNKWIGEYRLRKADGSYATVLDKTFAIKDEEGRIVKMVGALQDITKQRAEEDRLRLMESVILNTTDSILVTEAEPFDLPGPRILFVNKAFTEMTGYSAEEVIGKTPRMLQNEDTDRKELDKLRIALGKWEPCELTVSNSRKNGEKFWNKFSVTPVANEKGCYTHWIAVERDVTKEKKEEERLRLMESVIVNTNDSVIVTETNSINERDHAIVFVNDAFCKGTGYSKEEIIGKDPRILQCEETDRKEIDKFKEKMGKWENAEMTILNKKKNGDKFWANIVVTPLADENGWFTHWIGVQRDVTKEIEAAIEKENLLKELVENNLELKQFSYITSHNLRAPLTNLVAICDIIKPEIGTDALTIKLIDAFKTSTRNLNETLNDLIYILIIKENRNIHKGLLTFEEVFKKITESLSLKLLEKKVTINADFSAAPSVIFTIAYLESVFLNLLTNAVKYSHPDRDPIINIKTSKEPNGDTQLTFSDNGIGINMALAKDKIFGLYKRFHNNADSKGIGLYLVHSQITALGGKIEVESTVNIGTTFTLTFK